MSVQKATQGRAQYFDVAYPKKRREDACALRKRPRNVNSVWYRFYTWCSRSRRFSELECGASSHRFVPCRRRRPRERRDAILTKEACCLRIGRANRSRPRDKAQLRLTPKGFGFEGKSEFKRKGNI